MKAQLETKDTVPMSALSIEYFQSFDDVEASWTILEEACDVTIYQTFSWQKIWFETIGQAQGGRPLFIQVSARQHVILILPLYVVAENGVRIATWFGGDHANYGMALADPDHVDIVQAFASNCLEQALIKAPVMVDVVDLPQQLRSWDGTINPLLGALPSMKSPVQGSSVTLKPDFAEVLARGNAKRKRKKLRAQEKALDALGGYDVNTVNTPDCAHETYDLFLEQKLPWFQERGIKTDFADGSTTAFFKALASHQNAESEGSLLEFTTIDADEKTLAILGHATFRGTKYGYFTSIIAGEKYQAISPGILTFYKVIEGSCGDGLVRFDFGVGGERYKDQWCDEHHELFDVMLPLTLKGKLYASLRKLKTIAKRQVKENKAVWQFTKRLRRKMLGSGS